MTPPQVTLTNLLLISPSAQKAAIKSRLWDLLQTDSASPVCLLINSSTCIVSILRCSAFAVCMWQTVSVEFPSAWWSSEDWPYDGGLRHPLLRLQPRCLPVDWWASICILYSYFLFELCVKNKTVCERAEVLFFLITTPSLYFWYSRLPFYFFLCFLLVTDSVFLYSVPKMHMWNTGSGFLLFFVCVCIFLLTPDTCYILSFAIIMLNTSLHNPNVKDKTTLERFISMNRGINNGEDLPNDLLSVRTSQKRNHSAHVDAKKQLPKWTHS